MFSEELTRATKAEDSVEISAEQLSDNSNHVVLALASATLLSSCGGGGSSSGSSAASSTPTLGLIPESSSMPTSSATPQASGSQSPAVSASLLAPTQNQAATFLMQASLGIPLSSVTTSGVAMSDAPMTTVAMAGMAMAGVTMSSDAKSNDAKTALNSASLAVLSVAASQSIAATNSKSVSSAETAQTSQAITSFNINSNEVSRVQSMGLSAWLDEQFAMPVSATIWDRLIEKGFDATKYRGTTAGFDESIWRHLIIAPDTLRQRIALALSEILVVGIDGLLGVSWPSFSAAAYYDLLCAHCFGNYRELLQAVSSSPAMATYLTFRGNKKAANGAFPDENYAREILQLFTIGLVELNIDGTPKLFNGSPKETYTQEDVSQLARIFTGWELNTDNGIVSPNYDKPDFVKRTLIQVPARHETGSSTFLGTTVAARASTQGAAALTAALDIIFAHPNVGPFISKQLIQRLVTSNPSPAYVARVATVFNNDGTGIKGNLKAVIKAIFLDNEARDDGNKSNPYFGKIREPMFRFLAWARAFNVRSPSDEWYVGINISDPNNSLGQSPLRSPSVFNFFRPGYVPPNTDLAKASLVAPELQITNEVSIVSYVNLMQRVVAVNPNLSNLNPNPSLSKIWDLTPDYTQLIAIADNADALMNAINFVMTGNQLSQATLATLSAAIATMPLGDDAKRKNRIHAALTLVMASPEFIVQK